MCLRCYISNDFFIKVLKKNLAEVLSCISTENRRKRISNTIVDRFYICLRCRSIFQKEKKTFNKLQNMHLRCILNVCHSNKIIDIFPVRLHTRNMSQVLCKTNINTEDNYDSQQFKTIKVFHFNFH